MAGPAVFLDYDQETLDAQYNQRSLVPDADDYIAVDVAESARVREKLDCRIDVAYGPSEDETLDVFPAAAPGSPVAVYMHGGAWTRSDKANESFMAEAFVEAGAAFVGGQFRPLPEGHAGRDDPPGPRGRRLEPRQRAPASTPIPTGSTSPATPRAAMSAG